MILHPREVRVHLCSLVGADILAHARLKSQPYQLVPKGETFKRKHSTVIE